MIYASPGSIVRALNQLHTISLLCIDECHRVDDSNDQSQYMTIINHLQQKNPKLRILGLSGTPFRLFKNSTQLIVGENRLFKKIASTCYINSLIEKKYLVEPVVIESVGYEKSTAEIGSCDRLTKHIVHDIISRDRKKTIIFASTLEHAQEIVGYLQEMTHGKNIAYIDSKISQSKRQEAINLFETDECRYLVNRDLLGVGYDNPKIDHVALLRKTESKALLIQIIGRGLRLHNGKNDCLVSDYAKNFDNLSDLISNQSVQNGDVSVDKKEAENNIICPSCGLFCSEHQQKCDCGHWFISKVCGSCHADNSLSARHCSECKSELIDPNNTLSISTSGAEFYRAKVMTYYLSFHFKHKKCLKVTYLTNDAYNNFPTVTCFYPQSSYFLKMWLNEHYSSSNNDLYLNKIENIIRDKHLFIAPDIISYKKKGRYFNLI